MLEKRWKRSIWASSALSCTRHFRVSQVGTQKSFIVVDAFIFKVVSCLLQVMLLNHVPYCYTGSSQIQR